jgi:hypothetical protein
MKHRSASRYTALLSSTPAPQSGRISPRTRDSESPRAAARPFQEDFNLEHSFARLTVKVIDLSAGAEPFQPSPGAQEITSPSCVYLG